VGENGKERTALAVYFRETYFQLSVRFDVWWVFDVWRAIW